MVDAALFVQLGVYGVLIAAAIVLLVRGSLPARTKFLTTVLMAVVAVGAAAAWTWRTDASTRSNRVILAEVPKTAHDDAGYVSSDACIACHPREYHTWHRSFHRTMTQVATRETVLAPMDGVHLAAHGRTCHFEQRGNEFWVNMVDPEWEHSMLAQGVKPAMIADAPRTSRRVVMTTGSHHMQTYWVGDDTDGKLYNVPFVWLNDDQRWVPRSDVFLRHEAYGPTYATWHDNCIECHSTAGEKSHDPASGAYDPAVAELGIACEACHGPAAEHIRVNQDPLRRYRLRASGAPDPTIVNPARLSPEKSSQVCGQCHAIAVYKGSEYHAGKRYRPGDDLSETRMILRTSDRNMPASERADWPELQAHIAAQGASFIPDRLWPDGMVRVSGREYGAMSESACFNGGELSCLTCHSMHAGDPKDQLAYEYDEQQACISCHQDIATDVAGHTHHPVDSSGSRCNNCHMPHTVYGLLKAIRSHQIDSPSVATTLATGRPDACSLCHLDKPLRWTADHLAQWYGQPNVELDDDQERVAASVLWALSGDANQRALAAWHMGWEPAREASGRTWMGPYLGHLLADPYAAVRYIAGRSLRSDTRYEGLAYDYLASPDARVQQSRRAIQHALTLSRTGLVRSGPEVLIDRYGALDAATLSRLSGMRDDRVMDLRE